MRTSHLQFDMMVEFMETHGDLSKPFGGSRGRHFIQAKWRELTVLLNSEGSGDPKSEEKWRKVWSDYKNSCKKKCAKINRAASGTGGGPALLLSLTDLENRVMQLVGVQAATGMAVQETGFHLTEDCSSGSEAQTVADSNEIDWNIPGTSSEPTVCPPLHTSYSMELVVLELSSTTSPPSLPFTNTNSNTTNHQSSIRGGMESSSKKKTKVGLTKLFLECDKKAREEAKEREKRYDEMEQERLDLRREELRIREMEVRERGRQRDAELLLQAQWLDFMKEAMNVFTKYLDKKKD